MGAVWRLIEAHQDAQPYGASIRSIAKAVGMRNTTLAGWRDLKAMPNPDHLRAVARQIGVSYAVMLNAALEDAGYRDPLPEGVDWSSIALAAKNRPEGVSPDA